MPKEYRRLTAHLTTGSENFNERLSAYLTSNVAMRSAVEHAVHNSYNQQYGGQRFGPSGPSSMFPSPMLAHQAQQMRQQQHNPLTHRQAPYTSPRPHQNSPSRHQRSTSIAMPQDASQNFPNSPVGQTIAERRMSMPAAKVEPGSPTGINTPASASNITFPDGTFSRDRVQSQKQTSTPISNNNMDSSNHGLMYGAFDPSFFSGQLFPSSYLFDDPNINNLMHGSTAFPGSSWDTQATDTSKQPQSQQDYSTLGSTIAPSDIHNSNQSYQGFEQFSSQFEDAFQAGNEEETHAVDPAAITWQNYIDEDQWDNSSSQQPQAAS